MKFSWQNTEVSCHFLLQEIFSTKGRTPVSCTEDSLPTESLTQRQCSVWCHILSKVAHGSPFPTVLAKCSPCSKSSAFVISRLLVFASPVGTVPRVMNLHMFLITYQIGNLPTSLWVICVSYYMRCLLFTFSHFYLTEFSLDSWELFTHSAYLHWLLPCAAYLFSQLGALVFTLQWLILKIVEIISGVWFNKFFFISIHDDIILNHQPKYCSFHLSVINVYRYSQRTNFIFSPYR